MSRWEYTVNIAGERWITDNDNDRTYSDDDIHLLVCELNNYEKRTNELEDYIEHTLNPRMEQHYVEPMSRFGRYVIKPDRWTVEMMIHHFEKMASRGINLSHSQTIDWLKELLWREE